MMADGIASEGEGKLEVFDYRRLSSIGLVLFCLHLS